MKSLSFNSMIKFYDETRVFDRTCFDSALDFLVERFPPRQFNKLFEPGIGTGRIAIPLAGRGYRVTGVDISGDMLDVLKRQLTQSGPSLPLSFQKADVLNLPYRTAAFDMAVAVHLFYFIPQWKTAVNEILKVLRNDAPLVLMHTGTGTEIPLLNTRYKELCAEQGYSIQEIGVRSNQQVVDYCKSLGYHAEWIRDRWQWTSRLRLDKALDYIRLRAYSFTIFVPEDIHSKTLTMLESELQERFVSLATTVEVPNQVYLVLILRR